VVGLRNIFILAITSSDNYECLLCVYLSVYNPLLLNQNDPSHDYKASVDSFYQPVQPEI